MPQPSLMVMACNSAYTEDDSPVLEQPVWIQQPGTHSSYLWTHNVRHHFAKPFRFDNLEIIVRENQAFSPVASFTASLLRRE